MSAHDEETGDRMRMNPEWSQVVEAVFPAKFARRWSFALLVGAVLLVWQHDDTARFLGLGSAGVGRVLMWVAVLYVLNALIWWWLGHYVSTILFSVITGRVYVNNHVSFRLAGGYHLPFLTNVVAQGGLFAYYAWSVDRSPDPIGSLRSFWEYVGLVSAVQLALTLAVSGLAFVWFAWRHGRVPIRAS